MNLIKVICENNARPVLKKTYEILNAVVLADVDLPLQKLSI